MNTMGFAVGLVMSVPGAAAAAEQSFPYAAQVVADQAYVRSGPGPDFYPTAKLRKGQSVTVYQHDRDGYCAIRPPDGSFSWVAAEHIDLRGDGVGEVLEDRVPSRVGSNFSTIRDVVHVRLERGERVKVIGERKLRGKQWFQVHPPSGEFRWIALQDLDVGQSARSGGDDLWSPRPDDPSGGQDSISRANATRRTTAIEVAREVVPTSGEEPDESRRRRATDEVADDTGSATTARSPEHTAGSPPAEPHAPASSTSAGTRSSAPHAMEQEPAAARKQGKSTRGSTTPIDDGQAVGPPLADRLEQELSVMLAEESTVWEFGELRRSAQALLDEAVSTSDRVRAKRILRKIDRLENIKQRRIAVASTFAGASAPRASGNPARKTSQSVPRPDFGRMQRQPSPLSQGAFGARRPDACFAGIGTLRPVVSRRQNAPRYALVDQNGNVLSFVSPTGGLNLQPYIGRRIGVTGSRGFMPQYSRPHVTAQRVTDFGTTTRVTGRDVDGPIR